MKSICVSHKQLGPRAFAVFVNGAAPDPNVYLQHVLNKMKTFGSYFMLIQALDSGYPQAADHVTKEARGAFLILKSFKAQDEQDHVEVITQCELMAEEIGCVLSRYFKGIKDLSFSTNDMNMESVSFLDDNKCGVRVDMVLRASNSQMLAFDATHWNNPENIGFPS